jgi:hypothetical protein
MSILPIGTLARITVFHLLPVPVRFVQWTKNHRILSARRDRKPQAEILYKEIQSLESHLERFEKYIET